MVRSTAIRKTLVCEAVVFGLLITLVWTNELLDLPHSAFGAARTPVNWTECLVESFEPVNFSVPPSDSGQRSGMRVGGSV